ncbi:MAG TPA: RNA polymerase sigma factor, partial [Vicinamibacterales bacterium]|nr:RNA polymerase sigma factor [Vicinamibacterales bacterium]
MPSDFRELFDQSGPAVLRYLRRLTGSRAEAEDVLQDTFLKLHLQRGTDVPLENARAWIFRVATNLARDRERHRLVEQREASRPAAGNVVDFETRLQRQQLTRLTLRRLPPRMRQVLILWSEGFSYREIADI